MVGGNGRHFFSGHGVPVEKSFRYDAQSPTLRRAREITAKLLDLFDRGEISSSLSSPPTLATAWDMDVRTDAPAAAGRMSAFAKEGDGGKSPSALSPLGQKVLARGRAGVHHGLFVLGDGRQLLCRAERAPLPWTRGPDRGRHAARAAAREVQPRAAGRHPRQRSQRRSPPARAARRTT
ncbi:MAG: hypothetical protein ACLRSD_08815 [Oscillibacter sp.]